MGVTYFAVASRGQGTPCCDQGVLFALLVTLLEPGTALSNPFV